MLREVCTWRRPLVTFRSGWWFPFGLTLFLGSCVVPEHTAQTAWRRSATHKARYRAVAVECIVRGGGASRRHVSHALEPTDQFQSRILCHCCSGRRWPDVPFQSQRRSPFVIAGDTSPYRSSTGKRRRNASVSIGPGLPSSHDAARLGLNKPPWLPSRLISHRHCPRAELQPAHEPQVDTLR